MGGATKNNVSTAYLGERFVRHPLTGRNLQELNIAEKAAALLERDKKKLARKAEKSAADGQERKISPTGFSLNKGRFGDFPDSEKTAHQRGWTAYMTVGVPLVEERGDIAQPPPDVVSKQTFVNRTDPTPTKWSHTVEFSISNTISWSLQGQVQLTFGAKTTASLQQQLQKSMATAQYAKSTVKNSKDNQGVDSESQSQVTDTTTATSTATGTGELSAQLMLGITGSVSGSLTTSFKTSSMLSGEVASRVDVLATQRRQVRRFDYEFPVSFGGWVALHYPEPVEVKKTAEGPDAGEPKFSDVIAWELGETGEATNTFDLSDDSKPFAQRGEAEVVSTMTGVHEVFELEKLHFDQKDHPLHKPGDKNPEPPKAIPVELAGGLGTADGLAVDRESRKAYLAERYNNGKLRQVDLSTGVTDWTVENLGQVNDVALDAPGNRAYVADYGGKRLLAVDLSTRAVTVVADGIGAYGVALDLPNHKAYVSDFDAGKLIQLDLSGTPAEQLRSWSVERAAGVALEGNKAYVGQYDKGALYEVDLTAEGGSPQAVATNLGSSVRVALNGTERAYVCDSGSGRLHEIVLTEGADKGHRRVVAENLGAVCGLALDPGHDCVYVSNRDGQLLRIPGVLADATAAS